MTKNEEYYKQLLLTTIATDLERGYGTGENWIGLCERKVKFNEKILVQEIDFFVEYFYGYINKFTIITSLFIDTDNIKVKKSKKILAFEKDLCEQNFIKTINGNTYFSNNQNVFDKQYNELVMDFTVQHSTEDIVRKLSYLKMDDSNTDGHLFFVLEEQNLIIYPHGDNTGYGFFGIKDRNNKMVIDFLRKIYREEGFGGHYFSNGFRYNS